MKCTKCNHKQMFDFMICPKCGYDLNAENERKYAIFPKKVTCPQCRQELELAENERTTEVFACPTCSNMSKDASIDPISIVSITKRNTELDYGFNFGAGFLAPIWFMTHGKGGIGFLLIIYSLFSRIYGALGVGGYLLGNMVTIGIVCYCGSIGNRIAMEHRGYSSIEETKKKENGWNIAGIVVCIIYAFMITISLSSFSS
jgi:uncharacterized protein YbaR (Trm112 family)